MTKNHEKLLSKLISLCCFNHIDLQDYKLILCMQGVEKWGVE